MILLPVPTLSLLHAGALTVCHWQVLLPPTGTLPLVAHSTVHHSGAPTARLPQAGVLMPVSCFAPMPATAWDHQPHWCCAKSALPSMAGNQCLLTVQLAWMYSVHKLCVDPKCWSVYSVQVRPTAVT